MKKKKIKITDIEIAKLTGWSVQTLSNWKNTHQSRYRLVKTGALAIKNNINYCTLLEFLEKKGKI